MRALEGEIFAGADFADDVSVLLLQTTQLLDELVLVEIELELGLNLIVEQSGVVVVSRATRRRVVQKPLEKLDLVLIGPQPLKKSPRIVDRNWLRLLLLEVWLDSDTLSFRGRRGGCCC